MLDAPTCLEMSTNNRKGPSLAEEKRAILEKPFAYLFTNSQAVSLGLKWLSLLRGEAVWEHQTSKQTLGASSTF
jgi:hypothetical protein